MSPAKRPAKKAAKRAAKAARPAGGKLDLYREHRAEYAATEEPILLEVGPALYLSATGAGAPGGPEFQEAVGALYAAAYTLKFQEKAKGRDFKVAGLEGVWRIPQDGAGAPDLAKLPWQLLIRVPPTLAKADLAQAAATLLEKGKSDLRGRVGLVTLREGRCIQALHVGPYADEPRTVARMQEFAAEQGLALAGSHHEIYLSDPNRVPPARLRTLLRHPVKRAA